jgi:hypothetical protein
MVFLAQLILVEAAVGSPVVELKLKLVDQEDQV